MAIYIYNIYIEKENIYSCKENCCFLFKAFIYQIFIFFKDLSNDDDSTFENVILNLIVI